MRIFTAIVLIALAAESRAFDHQFSDTKTIPVSIGMIHITHVIARTLLPLCIREVPESGQEMARNLATWEHQDRLVLTKADYFYRLEEPRTPSLIMEDERVPGIVSENLATIKTLNEKRPGLLRDFCNSYFSMLADGTFLSKTPTAHQLVSAFSGKVSEGPPNKSLDRTLGK